MKRPTRALLAAGALVLPSAFRRRPRSPSRSPPGPPPACITRSAAASPTCCPRVPGYAANAETTAGSVANLQLMSQKKSDLALSMADAAWDGFKGQGRFNSGAVPVRTLMVAYPNRMHIVTVDGSGIQKFADLKGKRVSTGAANSATEVMAAARCSKRWAWTPRRTSSASASIRASRPTRSRTESSTPTSGSAAFRPPPSPTSAPPGIKLRLVDHAEAVDAINKKFGPLYTRDTIPAKSYPGPGSRARSRRCGT